MPTISVKKRLLDQHLKVVYSRDEVDDLCFAYGLEVDDVINERNDSGVEEEIYKIEIPANRYDLLCVEGLCKALLIFQQKRNNPVYKVSNVKSLRRIMVKPETAEVRRFVVGAILRGVQFDKDRYASFIDLQDKLHQNICRKRLLASVGTHDLDTFKGDVKYCAEPPKNIVFKPLNQQRQFNAEELMDFYADSHLREYLPIIKDKELYPVFYDEDGHVLSLPPIINGDKTKITLNTTNIFIEITGLNLKKMEIVLDTLVTTFSEYCSSPFTVEPVEVVYPDGNSHIYPTLNYREMEVDVKSMNAKIGINLDVDKAAKLLSKMGLSSTSLKKSKLKVKIPPTRHDILHECDVAEDLGLAYGFNNIVPCLPASNTVAEPLPLNKLTDSLRANVAMCGWTEVLNFSLCSTDDISTKMRKPADAKALEHVVKIANPKTMEFQVVRNSLLPGILKTLACNKDMPIPLKLFEVQDVVYKDASSDTKCRNERHLGAVYYSKTGGFEVIHGFLDRAMQLLEVLPASSSSDNTKIRYSIREANDSTFFDGRCGEILISSRSDEPKVIGTFGVLHPEVLTNFNLNMPCSALELNIEPFNYTYQKS